MLMRPMIHLAVKTKLYVQSCSVLHNLNNNAYWMSECSVMGWPMCDTSSILQLVTCDSPAGKLGVTVCYDLRFPEMYQLLAWHMGAQIMLVPSAFTVATGVHIRTHARTHARTHGHTYASSPAMQHMIAAECLSGSLAPLSAINSWHIQAHAGQSYCIQKLLLKWTSASAVSWQCLPDTCAVLESLGSPV